MYMVIRIQGMETGGRIPARYTCDGEDIHPALSFSGVPQEARSLALLVDDPDSPSGNWTHWIIWRLSPAEREIAEGKIPAGAAEGMNDFGKTGYGGPCPGSGEHRYFFRLYALREPLPLSPGASRKEFEDACRGRIIAQADTYGVYERER